MNALAPMSSQTIVMPMPLAPILLDHSNALATLIPTMTKFFVYPFLYFSRSTSYDPSIMSKLENLLSTVYVSERTVYIPSKTV